VIIGRLVISTSGSEPAFAESTGARKAFVNAISSAADVPSSRVQVNVTADSLSNETEGIESEVTVEYQIISPTPNKTTPWQAAIALKGIRDINLTKIINTNLETFGVDQTATLLSASEAPADIPTVTTTTTTSAPFTAASPQPIVEGRLVLKVQKPDDFVADIICKKAVQTVVAEIVQIPKDSVDVTSFKKSQNTTVVVKYRLTKADDSDVEAAIRTMLKAMESKNVSAIQSRLREELKDHEVSAYKELNVTSSTAQYELFTPVQETLRAFQVVGKLKLSVENAKDFIANSVAKQAVRLGLAAVADVSQPRVAVGLSQVSNSSVDVNFSVAVPEIQGMNTSAGAAAMAASLRTKNATELTKAISSSMADVGLSLNITATKASNVTVDSIIATTTSTTTTFEPMTVEGELVIDGVTDSAMFVTDNVIAESFQSALAELADVSIDDVTVVLSLESRLLQTASEQQGSSTPAAGPTPAEEPTAVTEPAAATPTPGHGSSTPAAEPTPAAASTPATQPAAATPTPAVATAIGMRGTDVSVRYAIVVGAGSSSNSSGNVTTPSGMPVSSSSPVEAMASTIVSRLKSSSMANITDKVQTKLKANGVTSTVAVTGASSFVMRGNIHMTTTHPPATPPMVVGYILVEVNDPATFCESQASWEATRAFLSEVADAPAKGIGILLLAGIVDIQVNFTIVPPGLFSTEKETESVAAQVEKIQTVLKSRPTTDLSAVLQQKVDERGVVDNVRVTQMNVWSADYNASALKDASTFPLPFDGEGVMKSDDGMQGGAKALAASSPLLTTVLIIVGMLVVARE